MHGLSVRFGGFGGFMAGTRLLPLWGVLRHVGRSSGRAYAIPVVALPFAGGFLIPLPFGDQTQWLKNIQAADRAGLRHAGHEYTIDQAEVVSLEAAAPDLSSVVRFGARRFGIDRFVRVRQLSRA
jgi:deazaflavin-dependent oxidoreductase (nitroreductase family)